MGDISLGPNVYLKEQDLSQYITNNPSVIGGIVGYSLKGRTDRTLITSSQDFVAAYGNPVVGNYFHYMAMEFLAQGRQLYCKRVINGALFSGLYAVAAASSDTITSYTTGASSADFAIDSDVDEQLFTIFADNEGAWGNKLSVKITDITGAYKVSHSGSVYRCLLNHAASVTYTPGAAPTHWEVTTDETTGVVAWASSGVNYTSEDTDAFTFKISVYVLTDDGVTSLAETWTVSRYSKIDGFGKQLYLETKINEYSQLIRVADNTAQTEYVLPKENTTAVALGGGIDGSAPTASIYAGSSSALTGWYTFYNENDVSVNILIGGSYVSTLSSSDIVTVQTAMKLVCENRKNTFAILAVPDAEKSVANATTYRQTTQNFNTNKTALFSPYVKFNDPINDVVVTVPPCGSIAGAYARTTYNGNVWDGVGGWTTGQLPNVLGLSQKYSDANIGTLDALQINCIKVAPGRGIALFGQRTQQKRSSALTGINVRRLISSIEEALCEAYQDYIIAYNNTEDTRYEVTSITDSYMDNLSARGAFQIEGGDKGYQVVCNSSNNTAAVIDANELAVTIFVKPVRSIYYVRLKVVVTSTGASFDELISKGYQF